MIVVTGAAGFIGSNLLYHLQAEHLDVVAVVDLDTSDKWRNLCNKRVYDTISHSEFLAMVESKSLPFIPKAIVHLGASSSTTERDSHYLLENNFRYTQKLAQYCVRNEVRFIYASSAATYGDGELGFSDSDELTPKLRPINAYGFSKWMFDQWLINNRLTQKVAGLRFFNVYGPNEYHKKGQSSPVGVFLKQILEDGNIRLFKSENPDFQDGMQKRDFVHVDDCCKVISWLLKNPEANGIINVGTGTARTWLNLAEAVADAVNKKLEVKYIPMPDSIKQQYQYFTQANLEKLRSLGYQATTTSLQDGVKEYIDGYLLDSSYR